MSRPLRRLRDVVCFTRPAGMGASWRNAERWTIAIWESHEYGPRPSFVVRARMRGQLVHVAYDVAEWQGPYYELGEPRWCTTLHGARERLEQLALVLGAAMTREIFDKHCRPRWRRFP